MINRIKIPEILISCISKSWGGMEIMAIEYTKQFKKHGFNTGFLCSKNTPLYINAKKNNFKIIKAKSNIYKNILFLAKNLKNVKIIHTHNSHDLWTLVPALIFSRSGAKLYLTKHLASGIKKKDILHKILYRRIERVFAISDFIRINLAETCPVDEEKISVINNGIDLNVFNKEEYSKDEIRNELHINSDKIVVSLIGRITPGKGHKEFISAAELINHTYGNKIIFLVTGSSVNEEIWFEKEIMQMVKGLGINNFIFTGYRDDVPKILAGTDILAFPSHEESFGITLLEAMAMGVPVIASSNAGIKDIIPSEDYGILVPPKDPESLAAGIIKLINDKDLRVRLALNSKKRVKEHFDIEKIAGKISEYYEI